MRLASSLRYKIKRNKCKMRKCKNLFPKLLLSRMSPSLLQTQSSNYLALVWNNGGLFGVFSANEFIFLGFLLKGRLYIPTPEPHPAVQPERRLAVIWGNFFVMSEEVRDGWKDTTTTWKLDFWRERALLQTFPVWLKLSQVQFFYSFGWVSSQNTNWNAICSFGDFWCLEPAALLVLLSSAGTHPNAHLQTLGLQGWGGGSWWQRKSDGATVSAVRDKEGKRETWKTEQQERMRRGGGGGAEEWDYRGAEGEEWASEWVWWKNQWLCRKETGKESRGGRMKT